MLNGVQERLAEIALERGSFLLLLNLILRLILRSWFGCTGKSQRCSLPTRIGCSIPTALDPLQQGDTTAEALKPKRLVRPL